MKTLRAFPVVPLKTRWVGILLSAALLGSVAVISAIRTQPERYVRVNGFDQWWGIEVKRDLVVAYFGCSTGDQPTIAGVEPLAKMFPEGLGVRAGRQLIQPALGIMARVNNFDASEIVGAAVDQRRAGAWNSLPVEQDRLRLCSLEGAG